MGRTALVLAFLASAAASSVSFGQEKLPPPRSVEEPAPQPRMIVPPGNMLSPYAPSHPPQLGTREVWQYYGVDSSGRFRRRVILAPQGAYYAINGEPYPWTTNHPQLFMPYAVD